MVHADEAGKRNKRRKRDLKKEGKKALSMNVQQKRNSDLKQSCEAEQSKLIETSTQERNADGWSANVQNSTVSNPKAYVRQQQFEVLDKIASFAEAATFMCTISKRDPANKNEAETPKSTRNTKALHLLSNLLSGMDKAKTRSYATTLKNGLVLSKCKILMQHRKLQRQTTRLNSESNKMMALISSITDMPQP